MNLRTFCINKNIVYKEVSINSPVINKIYEIYNPECEQIVAIPDGCIDIEFVWQNGRMNSLLCGSLLKGTVSEIGTYEYCFGIKFNPGMLPKCISADVNEVVNSRCNLYDFAEIDILEQRILQNGSFEDKMDYFIRKFDVQPIGIEKDEITSYIIKEVNKCNGAVNVSSIVENIGYSHCYTDRVFKNKVGVSIKKYAGIVRLQKSIDILNADNKEDIFEDLGYYDQAHFIKDFKKFTLITPEVYKRKSDCVKIV